jgi:hypothetical protein
MFFFKEAPSSHAARVLRNGNTTIVYYVCSSRVQNRTTILQYVGSSANEELSSPSVGRWAYTSFPPLVCLLLCMINCHTYNPLFSMFRLLLLRVRSGMSGVHRALLLWCVVHTHTYIQTNRQTDRQTYTHRPENQKLSCHQLQRRWMIAYLLWDGAGAPVGQESHDTNL